MEIREVKIEEYWPLIVKGTAEFGQIAAALNPEFNKLAECIYRVLNESFIQDASEYGVSRWESILGITPAAGATLDDRKAAILTYMNIKLPYTWRVLKQMLVPILGGEDKFVMEYVNDEGKLVLHTDRLDDVMLATVDELLARVLPQNIEVVRYNHNMEISWRDINKYAKCVTFADFRAVNPDYKNDVTSDGEWVYLLTSFNYEEWYGGLFKDSKAIKKINTSMPASTSCRGTFVGAVNLEEAIVSAPKATSAGDFANNCNKLTFLEVDIPKATNMYHSFAKNKNLSHFRFLSPTKLSDARLAWSDAILDKSSVLNIVEMTPAFTSGTHEMELGIHIDYQNNEEVLAAIANAERKGWTLTVQWNGTPTSGVSTTDLEEIYVKVTVLDEEHVQYGEYTDENGNRCTLDWGHYVTDTSEYKLFYSLVEAEQYFKLTKVNENE